MRKRASKSLWMGSFEIVRKNGTSGAIVVIVVMFHLSRGTKGKIEDRLNSRGEHIRIRGRGRVLDLVS